MFYLYDFVFSSRILFDNLFSDVMSSTSTRRTTRSRNKTSADVTKTGCDVDDTFDMNDDEDNDPDYNFEADLKEVVNENHNFKDCTTASDDDKTGTRFESVKSVSKNVTSKEHVQVQPLVVADATSEAGSVPLKNPIEANKSICVEGEESIFDSVLEEVLDDASLENEKVTRPTKSDAKSE